MTALKDIIKLEAPALWRPDAETQRREVYASVGDNSLVILDANGTALAHWSLPALQRLNPGKMPAVYAPARDDTEELEISDDTMVEALEKVRRAIAAARPHPGRLRWLTLGATTAALVALGVFWLPDTLRDHTLRVLPDEKRLLLGRAMLADLSRFSGEPCRSSRSAEALAALNGRILPGTGTELVVLRHAAQPTMHLPGNMILISSGLLTDYDTPEVVSGFIMSEFLQSQKQDPLKGFLEFAGFNATFRLLTTGEVNPDQLRAYTERLLVRQLDPIPQDRLLEIFDKIDLPTSPYAYAVDPSGERTLTLIEADPMLGKQQVPILTDGDWLSLQNICEA